MSFSMTDGKVFSPYIRDAEFAVRKPWRVSERRLLDYLLVYIQEGECLFSVDGVDYHLNSGDFCLIQPGQRVSLEGLTNTVTPYAHFDIVYNPLRKQSFATRPGQLNLDAYIELLQPRLDLFGTQIPTCFHPPAIEDFIAKWLRLIRAWSMGGRLEQLSAENSLGALILELMCRYQRNGLSDSQPSSLSWIPSYLSTHLAAPVSVKEMADRARLSPSRFHAVFQNAFGTTPGRYLSELRVRHAAELLETTDWTLAHIAGLCGFADVHHFSKAFKRRMAKTPGQYRREKR
jgi:AraC-like DNA-binding protein